MAPRKAVAAPKPARVTRARAVDAGQEAPADEAPKRKTAMNESLPTTTRAKAIESRSRVAKKPATSTATKSTSSRTRSTRAAAPVGEPAESDEDEQQAEDKVMKDAASPPATRSKPTRSVNATATLAAAPRRRLKVTPLDAPATETVPEPVEVKARKSASKTKKDAAPARSRRAAAVADQEENTNQDSEMKDIELPKKRTARSKAGISKEDPISTAAAVAVAEPEAPKTRGRARKITKQTEPTVIEAEEHQASEEPPARQTRARGGSAPSIVVEIPAKSAGPPRKKVTFQDLPDEEDEKENLLLSKSKAGKKSTTASAKKAEPAAKGIRAKPLRKPVTTATRTKRGAASTVSITANDDADAQQQSKIAARALTPKKITQVAKAVPEDSDEEDELSGAKTPIRDLSLSPRRNLLISPVRNPSPVRKLDFTPALNAKPASPNKLDDASAAGFMSPPRRLPASPPKEIFDASPRRAPEGISIFRAQIPDGPSGVHTLQPSNKASLLEQSPKRGILDNAFFPASAQKHKSPSKAALLSSPARRLFSPSKRMTPRFSPSPKKKESTNNLSVVAEKSSPGDTAISMSSHFRSSVSPQRSARVYRMSDDELAMDHPDDDIDFEASVLNVRSPLKVDKSVAMAPDPFISHVDLGEDEVDNDTEEANLDSEATSVRHQEDPDETIVDDDALTQSDRDEDEEIGGSPAIVTADTAVASPARVENQFSSSSPRFNQPRGNDGDSEDELAIEQTPINRFSKPTRPSLGAANINSRLSTGIAPLSASRNLGFTPLAAQMNSWRAGSPLKKSPVAQVKDSFSASFSPLASAHVEGSVEMNRQPTPLRSAKKRKSFAASRMSLVPSMTGSPLAADFFDEGMAAQDFDEQIENVDLAINDNNLHEMVPGDANDADNATESDVEAEYSQEDSEISDQEQGELTTDLIKFTNASDTAVVDFEALAHEADELARRHENDAALATCIEGPETVDDREDDPADMVDVAEDQGAEEQVVTAPLVADEVDEVAGVDATAPARDPPDTRATAHIDNDVFEQPAILEQDNVLGAASPTPLAEEKDEALDAVRIDNEVFDQSAIVECDNVLNATSPVAASQCHEQQQDASPEQISEVDAAPSVPFESSPEVAASKPNVLNSVEYMDFNVTPVRRDQGAPRYLNTVVSKVPLKPEGGVSPLKVSKKRARSMSASGLFVAKRRSLGCPEGIAPIPAEANLATVATPKAAMFSPQRRIRSAAPSPAYSLASGLTTPGQMSFAIDDFGDSTLDGIELPEDEMDVDDDDATEDEAPEKMDTDYSMMTIGSAIFKTPKAPTSRVVAAPASGRSVAAVTPLGRVAKTPTNSSMKKTPATVKSSRAVAKTPVSNRTPLQAVANGPLVGSVVFVDVHTTEGADASGIYVELLTAMGARCVKDWRWNPRASMPANVAEGTVAANPGITHVVFKDGGKRTLEKVRAAKGQVACVGAAWVLDCEREAKWMDEAAYAVDSSIMPRGGSRRRKSMEPRALINQNGSLSAAKDRRSMGDRRSVSAEYAGLTEEMRADLVNTPIRGRELVEKPDEDDEDEETELSSTYNSPTAATVGETMDVARIMSPAQEEESMLATGITPYTARMLEHADTPEATLTVDYDPASDPVTPALVSKGRQLLQMSAPPKQINKGIFEDDDSDGKENVEDKEKIKLKLHGKKFDARRKTLGAGLGFKPIVGSPLRRDA